MSSKQSDPAPNPAEPTTILFVTNPGGATHDVKDTHPAVAWARAGLNGWRMATRTEVVACCKKNRTDPAEYLARMVEDN